ncbi:Nucleophosmin [Fukomys damarensis]|uniref:Nucleophosmin n=1 Tax=Fukomys damarensis TaxID=885580 RepID=A0A091D7X3_FUKDA|nr:Nucleophosmin [Fukomys damarensis]
MAIHQLQACFDFCFPLALGSRGADQLTKLILDDTNALGEKLYDLYVYDVPPLLQSPLSVSPMQWQLSKLRYVMVALVDGKSICANWMGIQGDPEVLQGVYLLFWAFSSLSVQLLVSTSALIASPRQAATAASRKPRHWYGSGLWYAKFPAQDDDDFDDEETEEKSPMKKLIWDTPAKNAQKSNQNGKDSKPSTPRSKGQDSFKKEKTPKTPKGPSSVEDIKEKMQASGEKAH